MGMGGKSGVEIVRGSLLKAEGVNVSMYILSWWKFGDGINYIRKICPPTPFVNLRSTTYSHDV